MMFYIVSCVYDVHWTSWICRVLLYHMNIWKHFANFSSNILSYSPSGIPINYRLAHFKYHRFLMLCLFFLIISFCQFHFRFSIAIPSFTNFFSGYVLYVFNCIHCVFHLRHCSFHTEIQFGSALYLSFLYVSIQLFKHLNTFVRMVVMSLLIYHLCELCISFNWLVYRHMICIFLILCISVF